MNKQGYFGINNEVLKRMKALLAATVLTIGVGTLSGCTDKEIIETPLPVPSPSVTETVRPTETVKPTQPVEPTVTPSPTPSPSNSVEPSVKPTESVEPSNKPENTVKPSNSPKPVESSKPIESNQPVGPEQTPNVTPTPTPDLSKVYQDSAATIVKSCKTKLESLKTKKQNMLSSIETLKTRYTSLKNDYDNLKKVLADADALIAKSDKKIQPELQIVRDKIQAQLDSLKNVLEDIDKITKEYDALNTSDIEKELARLEANIGNAKTEADLKAYNDLETKLDNLLSSNCLKDNQNLGKNNTSLSDAKDNYSEMQTIKKEYDNQKNNSSSSGGGGSVTPPEPSKEPDIDNTYDKNDNIDDSIHKDPEAPLPEPEEESIDMEPTVMSVATVGGQSYVLLYSGRKNR